MKNKLKIITNHKWLLIPSIALLTCLMIVVLVLNVICAVPGGKGIIPEVNRISTNKKVVMLSFDDGPTVDDNAIVDILNKNHVHAVFFEMGRNLSHYFGDSTDPKRDSTRNAVHNILSNGNWIGNHTFSHQFYVNNGLRLDKDVAKQYDLIKKVYLNETGMNLKNSDIPLRLSYLQYDKGVDWMANHEKIHYLVRGYLGTDWMGDKAGKKVILSEYYSHLRPGIILCSHTRSYARFWLDDLIKHLKSLNYEFASFNFNQPDYYKNFGKLVN